jgi:hypothetical protein
MVAYQGWVGTAQQQQEGWVGGCTPALPVQAMLQLQQQAVHPQQHWVATATWAVEPWVDSAVRLVVEVVVMGHTVTVAAARQRQQQQLVPPPVWGMAAAAVAMGAMLV